MKNDIKIFFLTLILVVSSVLANAQTYTWKNAPIGGGGFVTGIVTHKTSGDRYCRTDVGGAYRWDAANNKWIQLLDWLKESDHGLYAVDALAIDPQNANNVYMFCGNRDTNFGRTAILKSTDKGNTFTYTDVTSKFKTHGNGNGRGNGERLAVDPKNSNILFCGTRADGLWKSTDAGLTWNLAWDGVTTTPNLNGICFVLFDPLGSVVNGVSQTIYIGISRTGGGNIYKSTNGGASFTDISPTTSFMPHRVALQGTTMYVTYADGAGGDDANGNGKLYKLNTSTEAWTNVTPIQSKDYSYGGVSIDPTNVNRIIISTFNIYSNNQFGTGWGDFIFLSADGGSTWTLKNGTNATFDNNGMGWHAGGLNWMDCIEFDQDNLSKVRVIGGRGIYTCSDITATNPLWKYDVVGLEETAFLDGISIPGGPFISALGDESGFVHESLTSPPSSLSAKLIGGTNTTSIAYAAGNPNKVVRISNQGNVVYYSTDKGATWTGAATNVGVQGRVDISADGGTVLHCPWGSTTTSYTTNNGGSWSGCLGVSVENAAPVADKVNSNYFYIYNPQTGAMFRSSNKGVNFSLAGTPGASTANHPWQPVLIRTIPGFEGHIWVPLASNGLKYSTNAGAGYTTVANVTYCKSIGIGKTMYGASYPTIFIWGTVSGVTGLFRSTDQRTTWLRMNDDAHQFGGAPLLIGDMNVDGRVYMGAGGARGIIYWDPADFSDPSASYVTLANRSTDLLMDGMYRLDNGSNAGQYGNSGTTAQQWSIETVGNYVMLKNRASNLYLDGMYRNSDGSVVGQYSNSGSDAQYWTRETTGSYVKFKNKATGLYLDGMGSTANGADLYQWSQSSSFNQEWSINIIGTQNLKVNSVSKDGISEESDISIAFYPNPFSTEFKVEVPKSNEPIRVSIFDVTGKKVQESACTQSAQLLMGASLQPGLYLVKVEGVNSNFSKSFKILKK
ncbi:RICIN domain-containing protein [Flavobacterium johnsoniae]|uniref:Por secretion system C-terminal sorting domain-containing protein n=1 Tax=Flavobacterium johnsoniae TaxID=986 RepID=A0A1M5QV90_FLAJO|nr:RICIN domain-containing protein [Flavobacterium johnsoniae]SHH17851.1 Por secretion system C-terminal sorting domain-containing protein [Flavobacterium johnsoniae]